MPLSRRTLNAFREHLVHWTLRQIRDEFSAAGIAPNLSYEPEDLSGERRILVEQHYITLDFNVLEHERKLLEVFETVLMHAEPKQEELLVAKLQRDGYFYEDTRILNRGSELGLPELEDTLGRMDASHLRDYIRRMGAYVNSDPALAIGAAKELVEATCKTILDARGTPVVDKPDIPELVKRVATALELLPEEVSDATKGHASIRRVLGSLGNITTGMTELRNLYGSGHGRDGRWRGVSPRHARLVAGSASTLATFLLETHLEREEWGDPRKIDGRYITRGYDDGETGAEINLVELEDGRIEVQGFALWINPSQPPEMRAPSTGDFQSIVQLEGNALVVEVDECTVAIKRQGDQLFVEDNRRCGGMNVTFSGTYRRVGPPQFVNLYRPGMEG